MCMYYTYTYEKMYAYTYTFFTHTYTFFLYTHIHIHIHIGNDTYIDPSIINDAKKIMEEECVSFQWQKNDLILIDNRTVLHSRTPFSGARRILASLVRDLDR